MRALLSAFAVLLVASWSVAEDKKDDKKVDLFPLAKGTKWEYTVSVSGMDKDVVQEVTKVTPGKDKEASIATLSTKVDEQNITEELSMDEKGTYRHSFMNQKLETPLMIVKYPIKAGAKWKETIKIGKEEAVAEFEALKSEEIKVEAGKYTAYPIVMTMETMGQKVSSKNWHVDGVGIVKQEVEFPGIKVVMELKKFTKGGKKDD